VTWSWPTGILLGLIGLALLAIYLTSHLIPTLRARLTDVAAQISFTAAELDEDQEELRQVSSRLEGKLAGLGCDTYESLTGQLTASRGLKRELETAEVRRDALLAGRRLEDLVELRRAQSRQRRDSQEALAEPSMQRAAGVSALDYETLERDIDQEERDLVGLGTEAIGCRTRIDMVMYTNEDVYALEERRSALTNRLRHFEERLEVYRTAREAIQQAKDQTVRSARDELNPRIAAYLARLTNGRYSEVQADEDLNLQVFSHEKGDWITPSEHELSRGTVDQLYLAVRLALLDLLYREAQAPLLLDDPFVKFDTERRARAVALCKEVAQDRQVLLFTCHGDYDEAADWVIDLPGP